MIQRALVMLCLASSLWACQSPKSDSDVRAVDTPTPDAIDMDVPMDAPQDQVADVPPDESSVHCDHEGFVVGGRQTATLTRNTPEDGGGYRASVRTSTGLPVIGVPWDTLGLVIDEGAGGQFEPHTFVFPGELFDSCSTCLYIDQGCLNDGSGNPSPCAKAFAALTGTLTFESLELESIHDMNQAGGMRAHLTDMVFVEVEVSDGLRTTPVQNGETYCVPSLTIDTTFFAPYAFDAFVDGHEQVDRVGAPLINRLLVQSDDVYNQRGPVEDLAGNFEVEMIVGLSSMHPAIDTELGLRGLVPCTVNGDGTGTCIEQIRTLAVGDTIRIDTAQPAGFPNGRMLGDPAVERMLGAMLLDLDAPGQVMDSLVGLGPTANDAGPARPEFPYVLDPR